MLLRPFVRNGRPGLIGTMATTTVVVGLSRRQPARADPVPPLDPVPRLKELAALRDQGVLTDEEFNAQKARILGP